MIKEVNKQYLYHGMWKKQFLNCKKEGKLHSHSAYESNGNKTQHRIIKGISMSRNLNVCIKFMENQIKEFQDEWQNVSPLARMHVNFSDNEDENYVDSSSDLSYVVLVFDRNKLKQNHKIIPHNYLGGRMRDSFGDEQEEVVVGDIPNFMNYVVDVMEFNNNINSKTLKSKENVYESYIKAEKGNIYYTKNSDMFLSMVKSIFISKNIPVRVYYDTIKKIYVFGNAFDYIHTELASGMKYYSKVYGIDEMKYNVSYVMKNCALFQVLPNDDFKKYDMGDGYSSGWFLKLDDLLFACRNKEYHKVRDEVPLFKDHIGEWMDVQYYLSKKSNQLNENSFSDKLLIIKELLNYDYVTVDFYFFSKSIVLYGNGDVNNDYKFEFNSNDFGMICRSLLYYFEARDKILDKKVNKKLLPNKVEEKLKNYSNSTISKEMIKGILNKYYNSNDVEKLINKTLNESYTPDWIQDLMEEYSCYEILEMFRNGENLWNNLIQPEPYKKALSEFVKYGELLHFPKDKVFDWFKIIVTNTIKMTSMSYLAGHEGGFPVDDVKDFLGDDDLPNDFSVLSNILEEKGFYAWSKLPNGDISWSDYGLKPLWNIINEYNDNMSAEEVLVLVNRALDVTHWNGDLSSAFIIGGAKTLSKISNESINKKGKIINESDNKPELITAYRGIDSEKFKFKNGVSQWFSAYISIAKTYGDIIYKVKLKLNNPADLTNDKELYMILKDMIKEYEESYRSRYNQLKEYLIEYIKEIYPDFDISNIDDNTLIRLSKKLKNVPYNMENNISLFNELNIMLDCISKQESWAGLFHEIIYPNWDKVIKTVQEQGYDSIISYEEASDRSYTDIGYVIWNNENIVSIKKLNKNINESVEDKILYIIRGVPGSGKSTLAHKLTDNVVEADQYFYDDKGNYNWSADKLNQAHNWCFYTVKKYMEEGRDKIAVANTFVKNRDYKRYVELAKEFGYKVDIRTCTGNYQNIHNVPDETVERMRSKFQETPLDESAENDKTLRDYAVKIANICLDALVKTKYETSISKDQVQIDVDKAFKKAVPMLKNSPYEYFIILVSKKDEPNASYGKSVDRKYGLITLPVFSKDPIDQTLSILYKHKSMLNKLYSTYSGDELKLKINEYAIKYLKKELEKLLENVKSEYMDILIHECTHLLDDVRRTKTYKSKEQELKDDKGIEIYYNSPEEQNAYYQETISIFDEWANQSVGYKTFDIFWDDFIRQYRGEYNMLNDKNKRRLKKRAYAYWYVYMKD